MDFVSADLECVTSFPFPVLYLETVKNKSQLESHNDGRPSHPLHSLAPAHVSPRQQGKSLTDPAASFRASVRVVSSPSFSSHFSTYDLNVADISQIPFYFSAKEA